MTITPRAWVFPGDVTTIRANPEMMQRWTDAKTEHLSWFAEELRERVENFRKPVMLARNYYAEPILNPQAQTWFSQSLPDALRRFDWVAVMAMPYMEKAADANAWLDRLIQVIRSRGRAESDLRVAGQTLGARRARTLRGDRQLDAPVAHRGH